jgi:superfamily II DNA or RNA helicase
VNYDDFVSSKLTRVPATGLAVVPPLHWSLFPFQADLVAWALRRGRAALFADTGLGKTAMSLAWAQHVPGDVMILAPLAVAAQTAREGERMGTPVTICRDGADVQPGINITNYERLHRFDPARFTGVVLDESSIIKHHDAKTLRLLLDAFAATPFRLCATATPSPNDYTELGTHAEFLGVCTRTEMLAEFFCHDGGETQTWRLKGHARAAFWKWVAGWAAMLRKPSDLGYPNEGYDLPSLTVEQHTLAADADTVRSAGLLFAAEASTLTERRVARRASIGARVAECAALVNADPQPWVVWCDLNAESEALTKAIAGAVEVRGSDTVEEKEERLVAFAEGRARVIVSKASICGFGLNWQHCARMAFVGVTDSYEAFYQAVRRSWRFGQKRPVVVHVFASEVEGAVLRNLQRKERDATAMAEQLSAETRDAVRDEVRGQPRQTNDYAPGVRMAVPSWLTSETDSRRTG